MPYRYASAVAFCASELNMLGVFWDFVEVDRQASVTKNIAQLDAAPLGVGDRADVPL